MEENKVNEIKTYEPEAKVEIYTPENQSQGKVESRKPLGVVDEEPIIKISPQPTKSGSHIQVYNIITGKDPSWQGIIYDLINSEQINPWDVDLTALCKGYFEKIKELEENDFFISSKILLAASLLLRIKSEILLNRYIKDIDDNLFGKKEEIKRVFERIEIDEDEVPILIPKSPLPRFKKVTIDELMTALDTAINTESRRINREIEKKQTERFAYADIPKFKRINIKDRIRQFYAQILTTFKNPKHESKIKLPYSHFTNNEREQKIACFLPMLHLSNNNKIWLEQTTHFDEIYMYLFNVFKKKFPDHDKEIEELAEELAEEVEKVTEKLDSNQQRRVEKINKDFENPVGDLISEE